MVARTIRVGVDASGPSRAAVRWAVRAARLGESVVLMHVVDDEWDQLGGEYVHIEDADGPRVLQEAVEGALALRPSCAVTSQLEHGSVARTLAHGLASEDLLVVGTHKTGYLRGRAIGTRSIIVASVSPCNVAVIPDIDPSGRRGVVVGIAQGDVWRDAVRLGADESSHLGQDLALIHATPDSPTVSSTQVRELLAAASVLAAETAFGIDIRRRISRRRPADALLDASQSASLLVLGMSRSDPGRASYVGSVIHDVLLNINAPVYLARNYVDRDFEQSTTIGA